MIERSPIQIPILDDTVTGPRGVRVCVCEGGVEPG